MTTNERKRFWYLAMSLSFIIYHLSFMPAGAQSFTQRLQQKAQGQGTVSLHQAQAIDELVNGKAAATPQTAKAATPAEGEKAKPATADTKKNADDTKKPAPDAKPDTTERAASRLLTADPAADSTATTRKSGQIYKITGYRVQAFAGGNSRADRRKAEQTGNQLRMLFPTEAVYTHFYSPRWICRMGNYRTYEEAHQMLQEVKKLGFTSATIVKGKISVQY